jgi:hypothetical protein
MRAVIVTTMLVLGLAACSSHTERTVVEPERTIVQPPPPPRTIIVPAPSTTIVCPPGSNC